MAHIAARYFHHTIHNAGTLILQRLSEGSRYSLAAPVHQPMPPHFAVDSPLPPAYAAPKNGRPLTKDPNPHYS